MKAILRIIKQNHIDVDVTCSSKLSIPNSLLSMSAGAHTLFIPWSGQGHLVPMVQLAEFLASQQSIRVTIVYTTRTHSRLQAASSPAIPNIITEIIEDGLNPDPAHIPSLNEITLSSLTMQQSLEKLLEQLMSGPHPVTCLISGTFCDWTNAVSQKFGIPRIELWTSPASIYCLGFYHHILESEGLCPFQGSFVNTWIKCIPGIPPMRASDYPKEFLMANEEDPEKILKRKKMINNSFGNAREQYMVLVNSIYELEPSAFDALSADGVRVYAVGPLFLQKSTNNDVGEQPSNHPRTSMYKEDATCLQWLDGKADQSTIYAAFGSDSKMSKETIQELAFGLEESGKNFLWVIRPGSVLGHDTFDHALPEGFQDRVVGRGLIVSWAPQPLVLTHPAIGAFLSHCGWNSTLESLCSELPIVAWPQRADQGANKKFIEEEWKVGLSIKKDGDGNITRHTISQAISQLMQGDEGCIIKRNVKAMKELMFKTAREGGDSRKNLNLLVQELQVLNRKKPQ